MQSKHSSANRGKNQEGVHLLSRKHFLDNLNHMLNSNMKGVPNVHDFLFSIYYLQAIDLIEYEI